MSIKQTEVPEEDLLLLLPAAGKWLSGDTYKLGEIVPYAEFKKSFGRLLKRVTLPDTKLSMNQSGTATVRLAARSSWVDRSIASSFLALPVSVLRIGTGGSCEGLAEPRLHELQATGA